LLLAGGPRPLPGGDGAPEADAPPVRAAPADPGDPPGRAGGPGRGPRADDGQGPGPALPESGRGRPGPRPLDRGPGPAAAAGGNAGVSSAARGQEPHRSDPGLARVSVRARLRAVAPPGAGRGQPPLLRLAT